jgi:hypothetical protein
MIRTLLSATGAAGVVSGLAFMGCITALTITGHMSSQDALTAFGIVGAGATAVTATHVAGNAINTAGGSTAGAAAASVPPQTSAAPAQITPETAPVAVAQQG